MLAYDKEVDEIEKKQDQYQQKEYILRQQIYSTISDALLITVQKLPTAKAVWDAIVLEHEQKPDMYKTELQRWMHRMRCEKGADV